MVCEGSAPPYAGHVRGPGHLGASHRARRRRCRGDRPPGGDVGEGTEGTRPTSGLGWAGRGGAGRGGAGLGGAGAAGGVGGGAAGADPVHPAHHLRRHPARRALTATAPTYFSTSPPARTRQAQLRRPENSVRGAGPGPGIYLRA